MAFKAGFKRRKMSEQCIGRQPWSLCQGKRAEGAK